MDKKQFFGRLDERDVITSTWKRVEHSVVHSPAIGRTRGAWDQQATGLLRQRMVRSCALLVVSARTRCAAPAEHLVCVAHATPAHSRGHVIRATFFDLDIDYGALPAR